jgi:hypothetical protein
MGTHGCRLYKNIQFSFIVPEKLEGMFCLEMLKGNVAEMSQSRLIDAGCVNSYVVIGAVMEAL